jgi:hypothetical protein
MSALLPPMDCQTARRVLREALPLFREAHAELILRVADLAGVLRYIEVAADACSVCPHVCHEEEDDDD